MTEKKQLIVFPRGSLDPKTKEMLSKNGYLGIEAEDPKAVVTVLPLAGLTANLSGDEIVRAMAEALATNQYAANAFGTILTRILKVRNPL